ncbi:MAG TPA: M56 family metallopeptidase [Candidatus Sulfotelmatobacter sp.]|nr:M56 family metallopeptidase [Candidatus Sulfotelmatobacter sp.]
MSASLNTMAEIFALRLLDSLIEGGVIGLCAALILRLVPRQSAATRFAGWFSALVAVAFLPWVNGAWLHTGVANAAAGHAVIALPKSWAIYFLAGWGIVAFWFSLRLGLAIWHLSALRKSCIPVELSELDHVLQRTLQHHGGRRHIALCISEQVRFPTAVGLVKPAILIPRSLMCDLSPGELNQVILHELAHFRRWDDWTNVVQQAVTALLFFHPAVWWIEKKLGLEREMACDDAVLAETASPRAYAECLARLAEKSFVTRGIALAQSVLGKVRQTSARVARILDVNKPAPAVYTSRLAVSLVAVLAIACAVVYSRSPKLVGFERSQRSIGYETARSSVAPSVPRMELIPALAVTSVKLTQRSITHSAKTKTANAVRIAALHSKSAQGREKSLVHLTGSATAAIPYAETFWIVVESSGSNREQQPVHQIQMWRVTVLRSVTSAPSNPIPRKET